MEKKNRRNKSTHFEEPLKSIKPRQPVKLFTANAMSSIEITKKCEEIGNKIDIQKNGILLLKEIVIYNKIKQL